VTEPRDDQRAAPADVDVAVGQYLHVALADGAQLVGVGVLAYELALMASSSIFNTMPRGYSTVPSLPSSEMVMVPSGWRRGPCWKVNRAPGPISKSLLLPSKRQAISPVLRSSLKRVDVAREEMSSNACPVRLWS
jgi:hypothetical protein